MLHLLHGPDEFSRTEYLAGLRADQADPAMVDLNTTELNGQSLTLGELQHHCNSIPFMAERRWVIVHGYLARLQGDQTGLQALADYLPDLPPTTELVLIEDKILKDTNPIVKVARKLHPDGIKAFGRPRREHLPRWIAGRAGKKGASIDRRAALALANVVGDDLRALDNELEKLALYVNGQRPIGQADVELLAPYLESAENFGLANAIGRGDARRALDQMHKMLQEGANPLGILAAIAGQFRGLLEVKDMAGRGLSPAEIARHKGWRSDYAARMRLKEANNFSMKRLEEILGLLLETDLAIKTGRLRPELALDTLLVELCSRSQPPHRR
ncbi:MAG: DNA polymerase III subunit delta [Anaerolineae bacterium]